MGINNSMFKSSRLQVLSLITLFGIFGLGCASGPELDHYPRREIDRPYTLPKGVASWHIPMTYSHDSDDSGISNTVYPIPVPLVWETSLSDDWNITWYLLPLKLSHQFWNSENSRLGAAFTVGFSSSSITGFRLSPTFELSYRQKLTKEIALDLTPYYTPHVPFQMGQPYRWSTGLVMGPLIQFSDVFAMEPNASFNANRGSPSYTANSSPYTDFSLQDETSYSAGCGIFAIWSAGRQWDIRPHFSYYGFGSKTGYRGETARLDFVHFW